MNTETTATKPDVLSGLCQHKPVVFDPHILKAVSKRFQQGEVLKYLLGIPELFVAESVINYFGMTLSADIKGDPPKVQCVELLSSVNDHDFRDAYGKLAVFSPAQFWTNFVRVFEQERALAKPSDSILGDDTFGLVFLVEKFVKDVPTLFAVNLYRELWKNKNEYHLTVLKTGGSWEAGHSFAIKVPE